MELINNNAPIGVFDSGVGGLTVAREITRQLPNESIVYFGDTARVLMEVNPKIQLSDIQADSTFSENKGCKGNCCCM